jgi:hypothetical protein
MRNFRVGDHVRVIGLLNSRWQNLKGRIVEIFEAGSCESDEIQQECAVDLGGERCWFLANHLMKTIPGKWIQFFRSDVLDRWQLAPEDTCRLTGDDEEVVDLLQDHFGFAKRRAEAEVDDFYTAFNQKMACATQPFSVMSLRRFSKDAA